MYSMTGFGHAERSLDSMDIMVDIRTGNGRYLDLNIRLPKEVAGLEPELRKVLQSRVRRGRVDAYVNLTLRSSEQYEVDEALVENYLSLARKLSAAAGSRRLDPTPLLQLPGVIRPRRLDYLSEETSRAILEVFESALEAVLAARRAEGERLKNDLERQIRMLEAAVDRIAEQASRLRDYHRDKLSQRVRELLEDRVVDENRLAQEVLYYAERSDISEEITRLRSHLDRFRHYLGRAGQESVGKSLDFLCQEMNREMNTTLSKSPLADISEIGVSGKTQIEQIREQVQNVE